MNVLVTGAAGLLGSSVRRRFKELGHDVIPVTHDVCDLVEDRETLMALLLTTRPDVVINTVGLADVDECESLRLKAWQTNAESVRHLAQLTRDMGIKLIHISTDQVFDGKSSFYDERDQPNPVNVYAWTKLCGERVCLNENPTGAAVVRTTMYGWAPDGHKPTFADWLYTSLKEQRPMQLFTDYFFCPLHVEDLADALDALIRRWDLSCGPIFNIVGSERVSKYDFAVAMAQMFGLEMKNVTKTSVSASISKRAPRPSDVSLYVAKFQSLTNHKLPGVKEGLRRLYAGLK